MICVARSEFHEKLFINVSHPITALSAAHSATNRLLLVLPQVFIRTPACLLSANNVTKQFFPRSVRCSLANRQTANSTRVHAGEQNLKVSGVPPCSRWSLTLCNVINNLF